MYIKKDKYQTHSEAELLTWARKILKYLQKQNEDFSITLLELLDKVFGYKEYERLVGDNFIFNNNVYLGRDFVMRAEDDCADIIYDKDVLVKQIIFLARENHIFVSIKKFSGFWKSTENPLHLPPLLEIRYPHIV